MWHFSQNSSKDFLFARQLIYSIETTGKKVFPGRNTSWHFDDKVGQKYLLEASGVAIPQTWIFYDRHEAQKWADDMAYPVVFKLRGGAGSQNVRLARSKNKARRLIKKAFGRGFAQYDAWGSLKERWRIYRLGRTNLIDIAEGLVRFMIPPKYARMQGRQKGYAYFQEFIPGNDHDIRVIVIGKKAFAIQRMVRKNDFRASGSGNILYDFELFDIETVKLAFKIAGKLDSQCLALDFVYRDNTPLVVEISYGFILEVYMKCQGYWTDDLIWHPEKIDPCAWMVEALTCSIAGAAEASVVKQSKYI
jgi:glutathione synthase/RimK-type ligase-like ATP-grasp enzyme